VGLYFFLCPQLVVIVIHEDDVLHILLNYYHLAI
jgi:hypothetical protein